MTSGENCTWNITNLAGKLAGKPLKAVDVRSSKVRWGAAEVTPPSERESEGQHRSQGNATDHTDRSDAKYTSYGVLYTRDQDLLVKLSSLIWKRTTAVRKKEWRENKRGGRFAYDRENGKSRRWWRQMWQKEGAWLRVLRRQDQKYQETWIQSPCDKEEIASETGALRDILRPSAHDKDMGNWLLGWFFYRGSTSQGWRLALCGRKTGKDPPTAAPCSPLRQRLLWGGIAV